MKNSRRIISNLAKIQCRMSRVKVIKRKLIRVRYLTLQCDKWSVGKPNLQAYVQNSQTNDAATASQKVPRQQ